MPVLTGLLVVGHVIEIEPTGPPCWTPRRSLARVSPPTCHRKRLETVARWMIRSVQDGSPDRCAADGPCRAAAASRYPHRGREAAGSVKASTISLRRKPQGRAGAAMRRRTSPSPANTGRRRELERGSCPSARRAARPTTDRSRAWLGRVRQGDHRTMSLGGRRRTWRRQITDTGSSMVTSDHRARARRNRATSSELPRRVVAVMELAAMTEPRCEGASGDVVAVSCWRSGRGASSAPVVGPGRRRGRTRHR